MALKKKNLPRTWKTIVASGIIINLHVLHQPILSLHLGPVVREEPAISVDESLLAAAMVTARSERLERRENTLRVGLALVRVCKHRIAIRTLIYIYLVQVELHEHGALHDFLLVEQRQVEVQDPAHFFRRGVGRRRCCLLFTALAVRTAPHRLPERRAIQQFVQEEVGVENVQALLVFEHAFVVDRALVGLLETGVPVHAVFEQIIVQASLSVAIFDNIRRVVVVVVVILVIVSILVLAVAAIAILLRLALVLFVANKV